MSVLLLVIAIAFVLNILCEGVGSFLLSCFQIQKRGYAAPYGMVALFSALEILYIPCMTFHWGSSYSFVVTLLVLCATIVVSCMRMKDIVSSLFQRDSIAVFFSCLLYLLIITHTNISTSLGIASVMEANSVTASVNLQSYSFQGYALLGSAFLRVVSMQTLILVFGTFYHMLFSEVCLDIIRTFELKNPWFVFTLVLYAVFYTGFNEWQIIDAYSGENWRIVIISIILWNIYCSIRQENTNNKYLLALCIGAGMFVSGGFSMITMIVLYCLCAWLLKNRHLHTLYDMSILILPQWIYSCFQLGRKHPAACVLLLILYFVFLACRKRKWLRRGMARLEDWLFEHAVQIFYVAVPLLALGITFILWIYNRNTAIPYSVYKRFLVCEPVRSYLFLDHSALTIILDILRWSGVGIFIYFSKKQEENQLRSMFFIMLVLFVNPLSMGFIARITGYDVYAYAFEALFNPFTDLLLFITLYRMFEWQIIGQWILEIFLVIAVLVGHVSSFTNLPFGLYENLIPSGHVEK